MIFNNGQIGSTGTRFWPPSVQLEQFFPRPVYDSYQSQYQAKFEPFATPDYEGHGEKEFDITSLLAQRGEVIDARVKMILTEIEQRRIARDINILFINRDQCVQRNMIFDRGDHVWDKYRVKFEQDIMKLENEKRREVSSYFKDVLLLKKELRDFLSEKLEEKQKAAFLQY